MPDKILGYVVELEGEPVEWQHRDTPEFFDAKGEPKKVTKPAYAAVTVAAFDSSQPENGGARSEDEAKAMALRAEPGYHTVTSVRALKG